MNLTAQRCYHLLGLPDGSSRALVREAYQRLALAYHPDRNPAAADMFMQIRAAYERLMILLPETGYGESATANQFTALPDISRERRNRRGNRTDRRFEIVLEDSYIGTSVRERI
ncbi:J domain-containing protein [Thalassolituus sp.]|jgi:curved DNA-binding protein CbpA|uniref:J domain-containing protein n=1 Tax=Thalassolituus sp. TaxID=2030822 RepID=UPI003513364C